MIWGNMLQMVCWSKLYKKRYVYAWFIVGVDMSWWINN